MSTESTQVDALTHTVVQYMRLKSTNSATRDEMKKYRDSEKSLAERILEYITEHGKQLGVAGLYDVTAVKRKVAPKMNEENIALWLAEYIEESKHPITRQTAADAAAFIMDCRKDDKYKVDTTTVLSVVDRKRRMEQVNARKRKREDDLKANAQAVEVKKSELSVVGHVDEGVCATKPNGNSDGDSRARMASSASRLDASDEGNGSSDSAAKPVDF